MPQPLDAGRHRDDLDASLPVRDELREAGRGHHVREVTELGRAGIGDEREVRRSVPEQQRGEHAPVTTRRRPPPHDAAVARTRQGDVEQPRLVTLLLRPCERLAPRLARMRRVGMHRWSGSVVLIGAGPVGDDRRLPRQRRSGVDDAARVAAEHPRLLKVLRAVRERQQDDGELEPLRAMERHHLHRVAVAADATHGRIVGVVLPTFARERQVLERAQHDRCRRAPRPEPDVQQLGEMLEVGHAALAGTRECGGDVAVRAESGEQRHRTARREQLAPLAAPLLQRVGTRLVVDRIDRRVDEPRHQQRAHEVEVARSRERREQHAPLQERVGVVDTPSLRLHRCDTGLGKPLDDRDGLLVLAHQHRDVTRRERARAVRRDRDAGIVTLLAARDDTAVAQQLDDPPCEVVEHVGVADRRDDHAAVLGQRELRMAWDPPHLERRAGALHPQVDGSPGLHGLVGDARPSEARTPQQHVERAEQRCGRAPVVCERALLLAGVGGGREVRVDVGATEAVDRLLGVTDDDDVGRCTQRLGFREERAVQDAPLHRVGVLHLVDEHEAKPRAQLLHRDRSGAHIVERVVHAAHQLVERQLTLGLEPTPAAPRRPRR
jgi:hypothetical protein